MIQKEINEIRRRLNAERICSNRIYGTFVKANKEIISEFEYSIDLMAQSEKEKFMSIIKKTLSGGIGRGMIDIEFTTAQVTDSDEHRLLMELRASSLKDEELRKKLVAKVIDNVSMPDGNYIILLLSDTYDVPFKSSDGETGDSTEVFSYFICAVCPVKEGKIELAYMSDEKKFHSFLSPQLVSSPEVGFMFPCFNDRSTNIYNALFYTKNTSIVQKELIDALFKAQPPMSVPAQKETFTTALTQTLESECSYEVVQSVHSQICERITQHKESHDPTTLELSSYDVANMLTYSGVKEDKVQAFCKKIDEDFGENAPLNPKNIIESKRFNIETPEVKISVNPEYTELVETRIINGRKYILIPADGGVSVNGINIKIPEENE